jgi:hypothetical protein
MFQKILSCKIVRTFRWMAVGWTDGRRDNCELHFVLHSVASVCVSWHTIRLSDDCLIRVGRWLYADNFRNNKYVSELKFKNVAGFAFILCLNKVWKVIVSAWMNTARNFCLCEHCILNFIRIWVYYISWKIRKCSLPWFPVLLLLFLLFLFPSLLLLLLWVSSLSWLLVFLYEEMWNFSCSYCAFLFVCQPVT